MAFKNVNSATLEERLREELKIKLISARNTSKIPTAKDILDTIVHFADKCYLIADDYRTAFMEYEELQRTAHLTALTTGGAQKHFVEASMLSSKHRNMFLRRYDNATRFNNAHDIYEILVAGGIINELDRISSITELANRKPEDTPTGIVNAHYERIEVNEMLRLNEMMFKELLEREEDEIEQLKKKIYKKQQKDEEESRETKKLLHEMRDAVQNFLESQKEKKESVSTDELKQSIEDIKKRLRTQEKLQSTRDEKIDMMQESIYRLSSTNITVVETAVQALAEAQRKIENLIDVRPLSRTTISTQTERPGANHVALQTATETQTTASQVSAADWFEIQREDIGSIIIDEQPEPLERRETREEPETRKRRECPNNKDTLRERLRFLRHAITQDEELLRKRKTTPRKFDRKITKPQDVTMDCVFCGRVGDHYSDACPSIRRIAQRRGIIEQEERCHLCLTKCPGWTLNWSVSWMDC